MNILRSMGLSIGSANIDVGSLSGGERQEVAIARALHFQAKLLSMDEPTIALSVTGVQKLLQYIKELQDKGIMVIFVTHNLHHVFPIADRSVIMKERESDTRNQEGRYVDRPTQKLDRIGVNLWKHLQRVK